MKGATWLAPDEDKHEFQQTPAKLERLVGTKLLVQRLTWPAKMKTKIILITFWYLRNHQPAYF
jgi:hypothetical protein